MTRNNDWSVFLLGIIQFMLILLFAAGGFTDSVSGQGMADPPGRLFKGPPEHVTPGKYGVSAVAGDIDTEVLNKGSAKLELQLPDGSTVTLVRDGLEKRGPGNLVWRGRAIAEPDSRAILTLKRGYVAGKVRIGQELFEIRPHRGRKHVVEKLDPSLFPDDVGIPVDLPEMGQSNSKYPRDGIDPMYATSQLDAADEIDVMVTYSPQARSSAGGEAQVEVQIQSAVDAMNTAFIDSDMTARARLVHTQEVSHNDTGDIEADLNWATNDSTVAGLRDQFGADMVAHIVENGGPYCGIAWIQRNPGPGFASHAFSVTDRGCLGNSTFAHELGHNFGFEHNPENGGTPEQASYPWSFAHYVDGLFRTIMSYSNPCGSCPRQDYFSNPDINYESYPTGIDGTRDNARTGDLTAPIIAEYRASVIEPSMEIITWVPPYAISECQAAAEADFGTCDAKDGLTRVGLQFWVPLADGTIKYADHESYTPTDSDVSWWTNWCGANGIECLLTVYNNNGSWDWDLARSAFGSNRTTFVNALVSEMDRLGLDGVDIDLEGIGTFDSDRAAFDQFIHDLWLELDSRGKVLTVNSFHYIWNAPNQNWWSDWLGEVDNIHAMGYQDLYEGGDGYQKYSFQQDAGYAAGYSGDAVLMGMPSWLASWGDSSGRGTSAQAHVQEVRYDLAEPTGIAIWDLKLNAWQDSDLWCEIAALKGTEINLPPSFTSDPIVEADANEGTAYSGTISDDATDPDNEPLTFSKVSGPSWLAVAANGTLSGTPGSSDVGPNSWTVEVDDGNGGTDSAELRVTVIAGNGSPVAVDDSDTCNEDSSVTVDVLFNDTDPENDPLRVTGVGSASNGSVSLSLPDVTYTPHSNFYGTDSFTYYIPDDNGGSDSATVTVTVSPINDAPTFLQDPIDGGIAEAAKPYSGSLAGSATDPDGDGLTYSEISVPGWLNVASNGSLSGTPSDADEGPNSFTVQVSDGNLVDTALLKIVVTVPPPIVDQLAIGQILTWGSVSGSYTNTHTDDGNVQSITEVTTTGAPKNRVSRLRFQWTFEVESGSAVTLFANAWGNSSSDGDRFEFSYSTDGSFFTPVFTVDGNTSTGSFLVAMLPPATAGTVYVRVEDTDRTKGATGKDTVYVDQLLIRTERDIGGSPPAIPTGLVANAVSSSQIDLTWTNNSSNELGFYVERSPNGSTSWGRIATVSAGAPSFREPGLSPSTTFYYRVLAFNSAGDLGYSSSAWATTEAALALHVADLDGTTAGTSKKWDAIVTVHVEDGNGAPVSNAAVSGTWSSGGDSSCTTDSSGLCSVTKKRLKSAVASVTFTVNDIVHSTLVYIQKLNSDPDEDSNGTAITIAQP